MQFLAKWQKNSNDSKVEEIAKQRSKKIRNSLQGFALRKVAKTYELTISRGTIPEIMAYNRQFLESEWAKSSGWSNCFSSFGPWHISSLQYFHSLRRTTTALYSICQVSNRNLRDED
jgi:hypothetical protein